VLVVKMVKFAAWMEIAAVFIVGVIHLLTGVSLALKLVKLATKVETAAAIL
jgi:hypothetical protein